MPVVPAPGKQKQTQSDLRPDGAIQGAQDRIGTHKTLFQKRKEEDANWKFYRTN